MLSVAFVFFNPQAVPARITHQTNRTCPSPARITHRTTRPCSSPARITHQTTKPGPSQASIKHQSTRPYLTQQRLSPRKPDHKLAHQGSRPTSPINPGSSLPCLNHLLAQPLNTALTHFKTAHSIAVGEHSSTIRQMKTQLAEIITAADPPSFLRKFQKSLDVSMKKLSLLLFM